MSGHAVKLSVSVLGLGLMGSAIARKLIAEDYPISVYNRRADHVKDDIRTQAHVCDSVSEIISNSDCIITLLADAKAYDEVILTLHPDVLRDKTIINMSTISPDENKRLQNFVEQSQGMYLECPVLGSIQQIRDEQLIMLVGSKRIHFDQWLPLLKVFGQEVIHVGEVGQASVLKLALNQLIASHALAFSHSLAMVQSNGLDPEIFSDILRKSALYAPMYDKKYSHWINRQFDHPNFPLKHMLKDINLIGDFSKKSQIDTRVITAMRTMFKEAHDKGLDAMDYSAIYNVVWSNHD